MRLRTGQCWILAIPLEVRAVILRSLLFHEGVLTHKYSTYSRVWPSPQLPVHAQAQFQLHPNVLRVCKQLYEEGIDILYNQNTLGLQLSLREECGSGIFCLGRRVFREIFLEDENRKRAYETMAKLRIQVEWDWSRDHTKIAARVDANNDTLEKLTCDLLQKPGLERTTISVHVKGCPDREARRLRDITLGGDFPTCLRPLIGHARGKIEVITSGEGDGFVTQHTGVYSPWSRIPNLYAISELYWTNFEKLSPRWTKKSGAFMLREVYAVIQHREPRALIETRDVATCFVEATLTKIKLQRAERWKVLLQRRDTLKSFCKARKARLKSLRARPRAVSDTWSRDYPHWEREVSEHKISTRQLEIWIELFNSFMAQLNWTSNDPSASEKWLGRSMWLLMSLGIDQIDFITPWTDAAAAWQDVNGAADHGY